MLCPSRSTWVRFATPTKDIGTDPDRFPLLFQSDYTLRHWPRRHLAYWRIISSFVPSQMALCCAQRGRCSAPDGHPRIADQVGPLLQQVVDCFAYYQLYTGAFELESKPPAKPEV